MCPTTASFYVEKVRYDLNLETNYDDLNAYKNIYLALSFNISDFYSTTFATLI